MLYQTIFDYIDVKLDDFVSIDIVKNNSNPEEYFLDSPNDPALLDKRKMIAVIVLIP
jgi:hypothetical protein